MAKQLPIEFEYQPFYGREDFIVADNNMEAIKFIESWPNWQGFAGCIWGPSGSGKTHLAHIFAQQIYNITKQACRIPTIKAVDVKLETPHRLFAEHKCLIVEDISSEINQEAMFHLYNLYRNEGGFILFTAKKPPARMNFSLADLQSRLNILPAIEIKEPNDELLSMLLIKLFADRQIVIPLDVLNFILKNTQRSFGFIKTLVKEIDNISIAKKRAISIPLVKEALNYLENNGQIELF
ncbi:MAG: DnaA/Hda family protein [Alphaproteobacteria bacterium]|nr:DnaA/Hda family protein [Alphaproteobacteria bacterium]